MDDVNAQLAAWKVEIAETQLRLGTTHQPPVDGFAEEARSLPLRHARARSSAQRVRRAGLADHVRDSHEHTSGISLKIRNQLDHVRAKVPSIGSKVNPSIEIF